MRVDVAGDDGLTPIVCREVASSSSRRASPRSYGARARRRTGRSGHAPSPPPPVRFAGPQTVPRTPREGRRALRCALARGGRSRAGGRVGLHSFFGTSPGVPQRIRSRHGSLTLDHNSHKQHDVRTHPTRDTSAESFGRTPIAFGRVGPNSKVPLHTVVVRQRERLVAKLTTHAASFLRIRRHPSRTGWASVASNSTDTTQFLLLPGQAAHIKLSASLQDSGSNFSSFSCGQLGPSTRTSTSAPIRSYVPRGRDRAHDR